ncbi:MAG: class I SAM-dependent methyltransferase [Streptomycetales bacterium]
MAVTQQPRRERVFATVYDRMSRPAEDRWLGQLRSRLLGSLTGTVLDLGAGTGANLRHYRAAERVVLAEPSAAMRERLQLKLPESRVPAEVTDAAAEDLPYDDDSFDAAVFTLVLCSVTDPELALAEARRVLKPRGRLVFVEHVRSPGPLGPWQDRLDRPWSWLAAGCHANRDTRAAIDRAGFRVEECDTFRPRPSFFFASPFSAGTATTAEDPSSRT